MAVFTITSGAQHTADGRDHPSLSSWPGNSGRETHSTVFLTEFNELGVPRNLLWAESRALGSGSASNRDLLIRIGFGSIVLSGRAARPTGACRPFGWVLCRIPGRGRGRVYRRLIFGAFPPILVFPREVFHVRLCRGPSAATSGGGPHEREGEGRRRPAPGTVWLVHGGAGVLPVGGKFT